jgi:hypothetical protein
MGKEVEVMVYSDGWKAGYSIIDGFLRVFIHPFSLLVCLFSPHTVTYPSPSVTTINPIQAKASSSVHITILMTTPNN